MFTAKGPQMPTRQISLQRYYKYLDNAIFFEKKF